MRTLMFSAALALAFGAAQGAWADDPAMSAEAANTAPDNTGRNERDRQENAKTPMDQSNDAKDLEITQRIRQEVVADDGLSTNAHNVKIIASDGVVTLRGPVKSQDEKAKIEATAERVAGAKNVRSQLEVAP